MVLSKKSNKKNSGKRSMQKTRKGGKKSKMTSKKTGKKGTKKGKGGKSGKKHFRKSSRKNKKKGGMFGSDNNYYVTTAGHTKPTFDKLHEGIKNNENSKREIIDNSDKTKFKEKTICRGSTCMNSTTLYKKAPMLGTSDEHLQYIKLTENEYKLLAEPHFSALHTVAYDKEKDELGLTVQAQNTQGYHSDMHHFHKDVVNSL